MQAHSRHPKTRRTMNGSEIDVERSECSTFRVRCNSFAMMARHQVIEIVVVKLPTPIGEPDHNALEYNAFSNYRSMELEFVT